MSLIMMQADAEIQIQEKYPHNFACDALWYIIWIYYSHTIYSTSYKYILPTDIYIYILYNGYMLYKVYKVIQCI